METNQREIYERKIRFGEHSAYVAIIAAMLLLAILLCNGCAMPGGNSNQDTIAKAQMSVGAGYKTLNELFLAGKVAKPDAINYRSMLVNSEQLLRQAEVAARSNDSATAISATDAATTIINQVTQALAARKGGK